jgi:cytochrome c oxidase assembly factor CtaG
MTDGPSAPVFLLDWLPDLFYTCACVAAAALYLLGISRLCRNGVAWPIRRTACWIGGLPFPRPVTRE